MSNSHEVEDSWLDQMGGESLDGSGFEAETPDTAYSNDHSSARFQSTTGKEPTDVHE